MTDDKREAIRKKLLEQRAVEDHWLAGGEVEVVRLTKDGTCWVDTVEPSFLWCKYEYRIKPKPFEGWINVYPTHMGPWYESKEDAERYGKGRISVIKVREVAE